MLCAVPEKPQLQCPGDGAEQALEVTVSPRVHLAAPKSKWKIWREVAVLCGARRALARRLAGSRGGFSLKRCLQASLWGFSSFHICWWNVSCCLHLSGLCIRDVGSSLRSTGELPLEKHRAQVLLVLRVVGKTISPSAFSHFLHILSVADYFSKSLFVCGTSAKGS